jgi:hypothetical protein
MPVRRTSCDESETAIVYTESVGIDVISVELTLNGVKRFATQRLNIGPR